MFELDTNESIGKSPEPRRDLENKQIKYLEKHIGQFKGKTLDIGCGDGRLTRSFAQKTRSIVGIDLEYGELKIADQMKTNSKFRNLYYAVAKGETLPFGRNNFNQAIFSWSL